MSPGDLEPDRQQVAALRGALAQIQRIADGQLRRSEPIAKMEQDLALIRESLAETRQDLEAAEARELEARATIVELSQALAAERGRADGAYAQGYADALAWALVQVDGMHRIAQERERGMPDEAARIVAKLRAMTLGDVAALFRGREG